MKLYHYTIADRLIKIMIDGSLKLTPQKPKVGELQSVWLTTNSQWDKTAFFGYPMDALDNAGRVRLTFETAKAVKAVGVTHLLGNFESLIYTALTVGVNPDDWFVTFNRLSLDECSCAELWKDEQWVKIPLNVTLGES